jgi:hypothetical protein
LTQRIHKSYCIPFNQHKNESAKIALKFMITLGNTALWL